MSFLNKVKAALKKNEDGLFVKHPLAGEALDTRLTYLTALAIGVAVDREASATEREAFVTLAGGIGIPAPDALELLTESKDIAEEDIAKLFAALNEGGHGGLYFLELTWLHLADGNIDPAESEMRTVLGELIEIMPRHADAAQQLLLAIKDRNAKALLASLPDAWANKGFQPHLPALLEKYMPFETMVGTRWLDHGNGTVTDLTTGVTWLRFLVGEEWSSDGRRGEPIDFQILERKTPIRHPIAQFNSAIGHANFSDWRIPTEDDIDAVFNRDGDFGPLSDIFEFMKACGRLLVDVGHENEFQTLTFTTKPSVCAALLCRRFSM